MNNLYNHKDNSNSNIINKKYIIIYKNMNIHNKMIMKNEIYLYENVISYLIKFRN